MTRVGFFSIFVCCPTSGQTFQVSKTWKVYQPKYGFNTKGIIMRPTQKPAGKGEKHPGKIAEKRQPVFSNPLTIGICAIVVVAFIVFSPSLSGNFLGWDDYKYIKDNPLLRDFSLGNILHVFHYKTIVAGNYHPLTILSYMTEYQIAGLKPFLYHFDNLVLHLFNILLFAWLMWLLTKKTNATLIAAALFAIHPMRVESVVWAAERKDVLYAFFFLLSMIGYVYFLIKEKNNKHYYLISLVFFLLSILSKGQAVVLPLTLFLIDYWFEKKITLRSVLNKLPYFVFSIASGILTLMAQHTSLTEQRLTELSLIDRTAIAAFNVTAYLYKLVYPFHLSCFYKYPAANEMWMVYTGALLALGIVAIIAVFFRKNKPVVFGSLFFLFTISIVSQILPVGNAIIADRYTYIPYIGLFLIAGILLDPLISDGHRKLRLNQVVILAVLLIFSVKTYAQSKIWHDNETLWQSALRHDAENGLAYSNLGCHYIDNEEYEKAVPILEKAVQNEKNFTECYFAYQNLGVALSNLDRKREAIENYTAAISRNPALTGALFGRGLSYTAIGKFDSAVADFTTILTKTDTLDSRSYYSRGIAFNKWNKVDQALSDYAAAIRIDPGYSAAYVNRGNIYFNLNLPDKALADYNIGIKLNPANGKTYLNRSLVYYKKGQYKEALQDALKARELNASVHPDYIRDLQNLVSRQ